VNKPEQMKKRAFRKDAYIYIEGDEDVNDIYIVERGTIELVSEYEKIKRFRSTVEVGGVFGFISALCRRPRMETAVAAEDVQVVVCPRAKFFELIQKNPDIAFKIIRGFAEELRVYDEMMLRLIDQEPDTNTTETKFFNLGEYYFRKDQYPYAYYVLKRYAGQYPGAFNRPAAMEMIAEIEKTGHRGIIEPMREGIYRVFSDRQMIFCEYEPGEELYIIKEGRVKIVKVSRENEVMLSVLKEGDIFGELAIVSNKPRNASAISWGIAKALPINRNTLKTVLAKSPTIIHKIFMAISQRIWFTYIRLESKLYKKHITQIYAFLENQLLELNVSLRSTELVTLNFGVDELMRMVGINPATAEEAMDIVLEDQNLEFKVNQIVIWNPSVLATKAKFYKSRDHLSVHDEEKASSRVAERPGSEPPPLDMESPQEAVAGGGEDLALDMSVDFDAPSKKDDGELHVPSEEIDFNFD